MINTPIIRDKQPEKKVGYPKQNMIALFLRKKEIDFFPELHKFHNNPIHRKDKDKPNVAQAFFMNGTITLINGSREPTSLLI